MIKYECCVKCGMCGCIKEVGTVFEDGCFLVCVDCLKDMQDLYKGSE